jgi:hypothetical protein
MAGRSPDVEGHEFKLKVGAATNTKREHGDEGGKEDIVIMPQPYAVALMMQGAAWSEDG